jgi:hypothetical protein
MRSLVLSSIVIAAVASAQDKQTFAGTTTDSECANADHSHMQMGPTVADCTVACVAVHGAAYVLYDGEDVYELSDQQAPEQFGAQQVIVTGTLEADTKMIQVDSIIAAR